MKATATLVSLLPLLMLESVVSLPQASRTLDASTTDLDFGQCPDLEIQFDPVNAIFKPANAIPFPVESSPDISSVTDSMCDILESNCQAGQDAVAACRAAQKSSSDLAGQDAVNAWNEALGVSPPLQDPTERRRTVRKRQQGGRQQGGDQKEAQPGTPQPTANPAVPQKAQGNQKGDNSNGRKQQGGQENGAQPAANTAVPQAQGNQKGDNQNGKKQQGGQKDAQPTASPAAAQQVQGKQKGGQQQEGQQQGGQQQGGQQTNNQPGATPTAAQQAEGKQKGGKNQGGKDQGGQQTNAQPGATSSAAADPPAAQQAAGKQNGGNQTGAQSADACNGKGAITNGKQVKEGSCNPVPLGELPSSKKMLSQLITFPEPGAASGIKADQTFNISVKVANLVAGKFSDAQTQYFTQPQSLENGVVAGHTHVTVQDMGGNFSPTKPLDAQKFLFFKGINDAGDGKGNLQATVKGGLPAGKYRVCTIGTSFTHQPALMPVARRGAQDDCQKFSVA